MSYYIVLCVNQYLDWEIWPNYEVVEFQPWSGITTVLDSVTFIQLHYILILPHLFQPCYRYPPPPQDLTIIAVFVACCPSQSTLFLDKGIYKGIRQGLLFPQDAPLPHLHPHLLEAGRVVHFPEFLLAPESCDEVSCDGYLCVTRQIYMDG